MLMTIEVPDYFPETGLVLRWENGAIVMATLDDGYVTVKANREGLLTLANHLLSLAQPTVPVGCHVHLDSLNGLEEGSCEIIIDKIASIVAD